MRFNVKTWKAITIVICCSLLFLMGKYAQYSQEYYGFWVILGILTALVLTQLFPLKDDN